MSDWQGNVHYEHLREFLDASTINKLVSWFAQPGERDPEEVLEYAAASLWMNVTFARKLCFDERLFNEIHSAFSNQAGWPGSRDRIRVMRQKDWGFAVYHLRKSGHLHTLTAHADKLIERATALGMDRRNNIAWFTSEEIADLYISLPDTESRHLLHSLNGIMTRTKLNNILEDRIQEGHQSIPQGVKVIEQLTTPERPAFDEPTIRSLIHALATESPERIVMHMRFTLWDLAWFIKDDSMYQAIRRWKTLPGAVLERLIERKGSKWAEKTYRVSPHAITHRRTGVLDHLVHGPVNGHWTQKDQEQMGDLIRDVERCQQVESCEIRVEPA